ncbi:MAG: UDP-2,3-diacylglucosamine diphosphatase LpxI [Synergistaceae bacterium]|nr:UDP-2,3-diacylglucosamine diphosphatase LpxI [Synergistaceae bacterium]
MSISLIAGAGRLPVEIARKLSHSQQSTLILSMGADVEELRTLNAKIIRVKLPSLSMAIREIKASGSNQLILAGLIPKKLMFSPCWLFDKLSRQTLRKALHDDHSLIGAIVQAFEEAGIKVLPYWQILQEFIAGPGKLSERQPTEKEVHDIEYGHEILKSTLPLSFGQSVCVADGSVVAIEAMEGTDRMILRAGEISHHGVVVKMMKSTQDMRYDLPTVGPKTLENMHKAGLTCLAVEAGKTLILEPERFFELSLKYSISVWGIFESE